MLARKYAVLLLGALPLTAHASFIETTQGTAVVNDATASYFNPAALMLIKNRQIIPQITTAYFHTKFTGQSTSLLTGNTITGTGSTNTHYYSPSFFLGIPATNKIIFGLALVTNSANRNADENSILRYIQSNNSIQDYDLVPAFAIKLNDFFSLGAGINFSYANFDLKPITGFPGSNIADSHSNNQSDGTGIGGNIGFLYKPNDQTVMGFNYRSVTTYRLRGTSIYDGALQVISNNYHFKLRTPARSAFSINHFVTNKLGFITTIQRIQWSINTNTHVYGIANVEGSTPVIVNGIVPYYMRDTWLITVGAHYRITPAWILRIAGTYNQSPGNPHYQITTGDSFILGGSMGYAINKFISIDGSYAHAFLQNENINILGNRFITQGTNSGSRDSISLKLTFNV